MALENINLHTKNETENMKQAILNMKVLQKRLVFCQTAVSTLLPFPR